MLRRPVERAVFGEDDDPGVNAGQVAGPQREQYHGDEQSVAHPAGGDPGHEVSEREGQDGVGQRHESGQEPRSAR